MTTWVEAIEAAFAPTEPGSPRKTSLTVSYVELDNEGILTFVDRLKQDPAFASCVEEVDFGGNHLTASGIEPFVLQGLPLLPNLKELDLRDNRIGPEGWEQLVQVLVENNPKLEIVDVSENYIKDEGARVAASYLTKAKNLKQLFLGSNGFSAAAMVPLEVGVRHSTSLKKLRLEFNNVGDDGVATLCQGLLLNGSVESLNLSDNSVCDAGAKTLATLLASKNRKCPLKELDLSVNRIGEEGCLALVESLKTRSCRLVHLDLANNPIGAVSRRKLCESVDMFHSLLSLDLTSLELTDEDAQILAQRLENPSSRIRKLEWYNNPQMRLPTEKRIWEAVERNKQKPLTPRHLPLPDSIAGSNARLGMLALTVAAVVVGVFAFKRKMMR